MCEEKLSHIDLSILEEQLHNIHKTLTQGLNTYNHQIKEPVDSNMIDAVPENEDNEIIQLEDQHEEAQILKVEAALKRIADNTYGICPDCGEHILFERLKVLPYAKYCVKCEALRENN